MKILVVGTGHVGLVTGVCFAEMGHDVTCLDIDKNRIHLLKQGITPIYEIGLLMMLKKNLTEGRINFTTDYSEVKQALVIFLCLPTPANKNEECDLSYIQNSVKEIAKYLHQYCLIVTKSTVEVGTSFKIEKWIQEELSQAGKNIDFDIVSNPEFLQEGNAIANFMNPDRIIIGVKSKKAEEIMRLVYKPLLNDGALLIIDILSSEMNKYASNAMLACRISFMNEMALICEKLGVDVQMVKYGLGKDKRIGSEFLSPGVGYGGSCFPKDLKALRAMAKNHDVNCQLIDAIIDINQRQRAIIAQMIEKYFSKLENKVIAIWGLSFKPDTDDIRESPSLELIKILLNKGAFLRLYDPMAMISAKSVVDSVNIYWANSEFDATIGADALVLMTEWKQFISIDFSKVLHLMKRSVVFDGRNQYDPDHMKQLGFDYFCIGRPMGRIENSEWKCQIR